MSGATSRADHGKEKALAPRVISEPAKGGKVHGAVVDAIGRWILGGTYAPDDLLHLD